MGLRHGTWRRSTPVFSILSVYWLVCWFSYLIYGLEASGGERDGRVKSLHTGVRKGLRTLDRSLQMLDGARRPHLGEYYKGRVGAPAQIHRIGPCLLARYPVNSEAREAFNKKPEKHFISSLLSKPVPLTHVV